MDDTLNRLNELQEIDKDLTKLEAEVSEPPGYFAVRQRRHRKALKALEEFEPRVTKHDLEVKRNELEVNALDEQKARAEVQLNAVKTNREYSALRGQIASIETDKNRLEDKVLDLMTEAEEFHAKLVEVRKEAADARVEFEEGKRMAAEDSKQIKSKIVELQSQRGTKSAKINSDILYTYERILGSREGIAMAAVIDQTCYGCFMTITTHELTLVTSARELVQCKFCNRILYLPQESAK